MALLNLDIREVVDQYVSSRRSRNSALSTAEAARAIRSVLVTSTVTDRELEDMIVAAAIQRGLALHLSMTHQDMAPAEATHS